MTPVNLNRPARDPFGCPEVWVTMAMSEAHLGCVKIFVICAILNIGSGGGIQRYTSLVYNHEFEVSWRQSNTTDDTTDGVA